MFKKILAGVCAALIAGPALAQYPLTAGPVPYVSAPAGTPSEGANFAINNVNKYLSGQYGGVAIVNPTFTGTLTGPTYAGDVSNTTVKATGSTTARTQGARAADVINVKDYGAVANATGAPGVGTDNTSAFQSAMSVANTHVMIPAGSYRFTNTVTVASGVVVDCAGQNQTTLWFDDASGTQDGFFATGAYSNAFKHCFIAKTTAATPTAGALIHFTDSSSLHFEGNRIGYAGGAGVWDGIRIDCSSGSPIEEYFLNNSLEGAKHDDVNLYCQSATYAIADVFFEARNYFSSAVNAAVELNGGVGWTHFDQTDFDQNTGKAILGNSAGGSTGNEANITVHDSHFEGNSDDINLTGFGLVTVTGNEFISTGGITCTLCNGGVSSGNNYNTNTGLQLYGVTGWSEAGSSWSTTNASRAGMVTVGPSGTTASSSININAAEFTFTYVPFLYFTGSSYPATNTNLSVNTTQGACWGGANFSVSSFTYDCSGVGGAASPSKVLPGDIGLTNVSAGIYGNLYYQGGGWKYFGNGAAGGVQFGQNSGSHVIDFIYAPINSSGAGAAAGKTVAGYVANDGSFQWGASTPCGGGCVNLGKAILSGSVIVSNLWQSATPPTISSGFGTSPALTANGTAAVAITVGTSPTGAGTLSFPSATHGWTCNLQDESSPAIVIAQTSHTGASASFQGYSRTSGATTNFNAGDVLTGHCAAY